MRIKRVLYLIKCRMPGKNRALVNAVKPVLSRGHPIEWTVAKVSKTLFFIHLL